MVATMADDRPMSFIERAKVLGANSLLGFFRHKGGFDRTLDGLEVVRVGSGEVSCRMHVTPGHANAFNTLHGGCVGLLVDVVGTMALLSSDPTRPGVSVELNVSFLRPAPVDSVVRIDGKMLKSGKRLGYTEVSLMTEDGQLLATGRHVKAFQ